jgi:hypothetical protein
MMVNLTIADVSNVIEPMLIEHAPLPHPRPEKRKALTLEGFHFSHHLPTL